MKLELFQSRNFTIATVMTVVTAFGIFGIFFPMTLFLQAGLGFSPMKAGLTLVPMSLAMMIVAPVVGKFLDRIDPRWFIIAGLVLVTAGIFLIINETNTGTNWKTLFLPTAVTGVGMGMTFAPNTTAAMKEVPQRIAGSASGIINTVRNIGQVLGIAVLGSILQSSSSTNAEDRLRPTGLDAGLIDQIAGLTKDTRMDAVPALLQAANLADRIPEVMRLIQLGFIDAIQTSFGISAAAVALCIPLAMLMRGGESRMPVQPTESASESSSVAYPVGE